MRLASSFKPKKSTQCSHFMRWVIGIVVFTLLYAVVYFLIDYSGVVTILQESLKSSAGKKIELNNLEISNMQITILLQEIAEESKVQTIPKIVAIIITFGLVTVIAIVYSILSLCFLLTHRAVDDSRYHCLTFLISPIFLIMENGILHIFYTAGDTEYYTVTMTVFSFMAVGVLTFASLKFSFELNAKRDRLVETAKIKPEIKIEKSGNEFQAEFTHAHCYFCGAYTGTIQKLCYFDIKKTGNRFLMNGLFFPNRKVLIKKNGKRNAISFDKYDTEVASDYRLFLKNYEQQKALNKELEFYWIFRDMQNYYYFVQMPSEKNFYNVIGVNEHMMTRLVYRYNKIIRKNRSGIIQYEAMDWFKIPYNFYPKKINIM